MAINRELWVGLVGAGLAAGALLVLPAAQPQAQQDKQPAAQEDKPYTVTDGKVDAGTYNGYRRYGDSCLRCHGPDGLGSSYAPSLVDSLKSLSYEQFLETVIYGKKDVNTAQQLVMPAFGEDPNVALYVDDIYGYLKARSDGAIGRGRPKKMENEQG